MPSPRNRITSLVTAAHRRFNNQHEHRRHEESDLVRAMDELAAAVRELIRILRGRTTTAGKQF